MSEETFPNLYSVILDSINDGVFTVDLQWRVTSFNRAAERITGVTREEAIGRPCCEVFRANICETACVLRETMSTGCPISNRAVYILNAEGERVPISISTAMFRDAEGNVIGGAETFRDLSVVEDLRKELAANYTFADIIGRSAPMRKLFDVLPRIAESDSSVLIEGASGTGKELFARALHELSERQKGPFIAVNCGALPDALLESELFGYKAGAFTDARTDKPGRFAAAEGGTLFLDEIGEVSPAVQVKLLRVLQERSYEPLGSVETVPANVRILTATNRSLQELVKKGCFREDLYYRIHVVRLELPLLRDRREDIPLLIDRFVSKFNRLQGKDIVGVAPEVLSRLMAYDYPGNVRELENFIEHAFVLCRGGLLHVEHLPPHLSSSLDTGGAIGLSGMTLLAMERLAIVDALRRCDGNRTAAAKELGINPSTLFRKVKSLDIDLPATDGRSHPD
jgi:PAS domain S-box-containing protein